MTTVDSSVNRTSANVSLEAIHVSACCNEALGFLGSKEQC
uniref:Uncharacterized protein n=1 Tax=Anguilla anguilla TaxID=7936 RepID=A0A0E9W5W4_ANGAN